MMCFWYQESTKYLTGLIDKKIMSKHFITLNGFNKNVMFNTFLNYRCCIINNI